LPQGPGQLAGAPDWQHPYGFLKNSPGNDVEYMGLDPLSDFENWFDSPNGGADDFCDSVSSFAVGMLDDASFDVGSSLYSTISGSDLYTGDYVNRSVAWNNFLTGGIELGAAFAVGSAEMCAESLEGEEMSSGFQKGENLTEGSGDGQMAKVPVSFENETSFNVPITSPAPEVAESAESAETARFAVPAQAATPTLQMPTAPAMAPAAQNGVDLELKYMPGWSDGQRAAADTKAAALTQADTVVTKSPVRSGTAQARYRKAAGLGSGVDADHLRDLQLGGADDAPNMWGLDSSVNRSLGSQINQRIKNLPAGTRINNVRMVNP